MDAKALKIEAARVALGHVRSGMRLGIGTGSTAEEFVRLLAEKVSGGMEVIGVPTSERTAALHSPCSLRTGTRRPVCLCHIDACRWRWQSWRAPGHEGISGAEEPEQAWDSHH